MDGFETFIGNRWMLERLFSAVSSGRAGNAYLFHGPQGLGKAAAAHMLAARLLAQSATYPPASPPQTARSWGRAGERRAGNLHIATYNPDLLIVEPENGEGARKVITIAQARAVRHFLATTPFAAERKVVVLDEAEFLTLEAGNALLKTLEEPQGRTVFLLIAHDLSRVLPTVRSRALPIRFALVPDAEIAEGLEARGFTRDAAAESVALADGCPGRAIRLAQDAAFRENIRRRRGAIAALLRGSALTRLSFAARAARADPAALRELPQMWIAALRAWRMEHGAWSMETVSFLRRLFEADRLIKTTNANPELVLETALVE